MAACGGLSVTNSFATKTPEKLAALSDQIIATEPTVCGLAAGLVQAAALVNSGRPRTAALNLPRDWATALKPTAQRVHDIAKSFQK
jgi:hypothetical protein